MDNTKIGTNKKDLLLPRTLNNILKVPLHMSGQEYIKEIALNLSREMNFKYLLIGRSPLDSSTLIQTDAIIIDNQIQADEIYKLDELPLELSSRKSFCTFSDDMTAFFSKNIYLKENKFVSSIGAPILSHDNQVIGVILALSEVPIKNIGCAENIIEFIAGRLAVEFERMETDAHKNKINLELEAIIEEHTTLLKNALHEIKIKEQQLELRHSENVKMLRLISHDLANPLQILGMSIEALTDRCPPELSKLVERMKRSTDTMGQILFLVRELQAFGAGKKELKIESVRMDEIIEKSR